MGLKDNRLSVSYTMRVPLGLMENIKKDIERRDDYNSISQWVTVACREYLMKRDKEYIELQKKPSIEQMWYGSTHGGSVGAKIDGMVQAQPRPRPRVSVLYNGGLMSIESV